ncbi:micos complex subunit mic13 [Holotrichia oblita]|uniref:Micos complex subunit mic13 n=1 Tax=Holotrichia oblita TaxID=644536 RepID=A0ACB9SZX2_HOLOL|nr:micos complex subunit mic13 [Holotrichia oblita]
MIRLAVKLGLAGGAVYYVADQGVWKDSTETTKLYGKINEGLKPYLQEAKAQIPIEIPELPKTSKISYLTKQYWNQGVSATFRFIGNLPSHIVDWSSKGIDAAKNNEEIKKFFDSFSSAPAVAEPEQKEAKPK